MTDIKKNQRQLLGTVIKNAGLKTVSVLVERKVTPVYGNVKIKKYLVHDAKVIAKDKVIISKQNLCQKIKVGLLIQL